MSRPNLFVNANRLSSAVASTALSLALACGGAVVSDGVGGSGSNAGGIGTPCVTGLESSPVFAGFNEQEVNVETAKGEPSGAPVCLVNHFRGRVTCPYGQDSSGRAPQGAASCTTGDGGAPVIGNAQSPSGATVQAQCVDRLAANTVIRSCRCANNSGRTDDGDNYCACPSGMTCASLVSSIGASTDHFAGSYCIKAGTEFDRNGACGAVCDPGARVCP